VGKHIEKRCEELRKSGCSEEYIRAYRCDEYVDALRKTLKPACKESGNLRAKGLWMTKNRERILRDVFQYDWAMTCFTEIKLSNVREHTKRYGKLGFGFSRDFVMERHGAPVHYVAGTDEDTITAHSFKLYRILALLRDQTVKTSPSDSNLLEPTNILFSEFAMRSSLGHLLKSLKFCREANAPWAIFDYLRASMITKILFMKEMSDNKCPHDFKYLDEAEWRIVYMHTDLEKIKEKFLFCGWNKHPVSRILFCQNDLKILVLPDEETRKLALMDSDIRGWLFKNPHELPIITTVKECSHF
jgi:hypothetical protein